MTSKILRTAAAFAISAGVAAGATAPAYAHVSVAKPAQASAPIQKVEWRWNNGRRQWHGPRGNWGPAVGAGVAAGIIGGALIGGAIANQQANDAAASEAQYNQWPAYCTQRYRSFDPASGTYPNNDGNRYPCQ